MRRPFLPLSLLFALGLPLAGCASAQHAVDAPEDVVATPTVPTAPAAPVATADEPEHLTLDKLFASGEFYGEGFQGGRWAAEGPELLYVETDRASGASSLVRLDLTNGGREVIIDGATLTKTDGDGLVQIEDYEYSADGSKALLYTDSERVWRLNTKGYYYVYDFASGAVTPVADRARASRCSPSSTPTPSTSPSCATAISTSWTSPAARSVR